MAHINMMAKPIRALELHYPVIQFLIIIDTMHTYLRRRKHESEV